MTTCQHNGRGGVEAGEEDRKCGVRCCLGEGEFYIGFVEKTNHSRQLVDGQRGRHVRRAGHRFLPSIVAVVGIYVGNFGTVIIY